MDIYTLVVVAICLYLIFLIQQFFSHRKYPPGPIGLPILGYLPFLSSKPYLDLQRLAQTYGNKFSIRLGSAYVVVLNDFESTKEAFAKDAFMGRPPVSPFSLNKETLAYVVRFMEELFEKPDYPYRLIGPNFETGAFFGLPWKEQRRFSLHQLRDLGLGKSKMEGHIQEEISELLGLLEDNVERPFCIYDLLAPSMSNNISSLLFGKRLKYDDPDRQMMTRVLKSVGSGAGQAAWPLFFPWVNKVCRSLGIGGVNKFDKIQKELRDYVWKEINEHEKTLDRSNIRDFIDGYLIEMENRKGDPTFCKEVLQDLANGFFGAGSETVRLTVEWLMLTVAVHQDAQRRIQREIDDAVGKSQIITWPDQKNMPFTEAFIMELMRWRTIIPINILRYALTDSEISGYFIPKSSVIIANLWAIHHDPEYWGEDADEFRPERFLTDDGQVKKPEHFIPFSIGKRQCPGEPMAKIEVFMYFTSILQIFNVKVPEGKTIDLEGDLGIGLIPRRQELIFSKRS